MKSGVAPTRAAAGAVAGATGHGTTGSATAPAPATSAATSATASATANAPETAPDATRERILDAADRLFYAHGIQSIGVDAVVLEAGISKRTLYKHFGSRERLVAAYLARRGARLPEETRPGQELKEILGVFRRFERWFASEGFRGCPFSNAIAELGGDPAHPALAVAHDIKQRNTTWFEVRLRALGAAQPTALAMQLSILVEGAVALAVQRRSEGDAPRVARAAGAAARALLAQAGIEGERT